MKVKNTLGSVYQTADKDVKLLFRATLIRAGKRDEIDYMKRFLDTWQYAAAIGTIPTAIMDAYKEHLHVPDADGVLDSGKLSTLKMA